MLAPLYSAVFLFGAVPLLAAATPLEARQSGSCNTGSISCCNQVQSASDPATSLLLGLLGVVLGPITGLVGLGCSPITAIGVGSGSSCSANPVCCQNNAVGGLIGIGCVPINLSL